MADNDGDSDATRTLKPLQAGFVRITRLFDRLRGNLPATRGG